MRTAHSKSERNAIYAQLADIRLSERDRQRAAYALRQAEAILSAVAWVRESIALLGAMLPELGLKH